MNEINETIDNSEYITSLKKYMNDSELQELLLFSEKETKATETNGIVAMLDVLGARLFDTKISQDYIKKLIEITNKTMLMYFLSIHKVSTDNDSIYTKLSESLITINFKEYLKKVLPKKIVFGDTIAVHWSFDFNKYPVSHRLLYLNLASFWLSSFMYESIVRKLFFRGAITIGNFVYTEKILLGPAITDVANWFEQSQMIGIVTTPKLSNEMDFVISNNKKITEINKFLTYDVPIKSKSFKKLYVLNWFQDFLKKTNNDKFKAKSEFLKCFLEQDVPFGTEEKYENTKKFFDFCFEIKPEDNEK